MPFSTCLNSSQCTLLRQSKSTRTYRKSTIHSEANRSFYKKQKNSITQLQISKKIPKARNKAVIRKHFQQQQQSSNGQIQKHASQIENIKSLRMWHHTLPGSEEHEQLRSDYKWKKTVHQVECQMVHQRFKTYITYLSWNHYYGTQETMLTKS